jgi:hypothetical protein
MKKAIFTALIMCFLCSLPGTLQSNGTQYYFTFQIKDSSEIQTLTRIISIDKVTGNTIWAYANDEEWAAFRRLGYTAEILPGPGFQSNPVMRDTGDTSRLWDSYPTYSAYVAQMYAFQTNYPNLCQIIDAGTTIGGRKILYARISDNISTHEAEPEVMYTSTMHGDETTGYILTLRLIDTLLSQYGSNTRITNLVNNLEIWINPNANPDGTYYGGDNTVALARRYNLGNQDLNRNYPDPWITNTNPIQPETTIMMNLANAHHFVLSANFHGGAEVVCYAWDGTYSLHVDNNWFINVCTAYATSAQNNSPAGYLDDLYTGSIHGVTNAAAWYVVTGSRTDWHIYYKQSREITIEISSVKNPAAATLLNYWNYNYDALLGYLENAFYGLQGIVTNVSGTPLNATITIVGVDDAHSKATTDPVNGDYIRMLSPGTYTVQVSSAGYPTRTFNNIAITAGQKTTLNVVMGETTQSIPLITGWNLISLRVLPANLAASNVFSGISASLLQVKDTEFSYAPAMALHFNTLSNLTTGSGYWVKVSSNATLNVTGTVLDPAVTSISLNPGWNLVAYLPANSTTVSNALSSISAYLQEVRNMTQVYVPGGAGNTLTTMSPNNGYWIKVSQACALTYPVVAR